MRIPQRPPAFPVLLERVSPDRLAMLFRAAAGAAADSSGKYRHWDTMRRIKPPGGLSTEEWWLGTKAARQLLYRPLPLRDASGTPFQLAMTDAAWEMAHHLDQRLGGEILLSEEVTNPATRTRYVVNSLIEEAVTSSQLEGAVTTRVEAKELIRSGRSPRTVDEKMVLNNFEAINFAREHKDDALTPELVVELQRIVTAGTLDDDAAVGRLQGPGDDRARVEDIDGTVVHVPPPASELPDRLEAMCRFANGSEPEWFLHPIVRSVLLHLWLAYDHPFGDGNGRTARALFYWSMLHQGYWLAEFLAISRILRNAPSRYARSFLYVETDDDDATYFVLQQLDVTCRAVRDLHDYLKGKMSEVREVESILRSADGINHRQVALLSHALRHPGQRYTFESHRRSHNVVYQSARTDLLGLAERGFLERRRMGKQYVFTAPPDLADRLRSE